MISPQMQVPAFTKDKKARCLWHCFNCVCASAAHTTLPPMHILGRTEIGHIQINPYIQINNMKANPAFFSVAVLKRRRSSHQGILNSDELHSNHPLLSSRLSQVRTIGNRWSCGLRPSLPTEILSKNSGHMRGNRQVSARLARAARARLRRRRPALNPQLPQAGPGERSKTGDDAPYPDSRVPPTRAKAGRPSLHATLVAGSPRGTRRC